MKTTVPSFLRVRCHLLLAIALLLPHALLGQLPSRTALQKADSLRSAREFEDAENLYRDVLKADKHSLPALLGLGKIAYAEQDWHDIKKWFRKVMKIDPKNAEANYYLTHSPNPQVEPIIRFAKQLESMGQLDEAKRTYKKALKQYAGALGAFRGLAQLAFLRKDWGEAKDWYKKILEIQPNELSALYGLGVAYREGAKTDKHLIRKLHLGTAAKYLDQAVQLDSSYRDVLYQRALVARWQGRWYDALRLTELQLARKPRLVEAQVGLFKFYRLLLRHKGEKEVIERLRQRGDDWARYFIGEEHRMHKRVAQADSIFTALVQATPPSPARIPAYLSLVRLYVDSDPEKADRYYQTALDSIKTAADAQFVFEDLKYILRDPELAFFNQLNDIQAKRDFFHRFWISRSATPAARLHTRILEHYRRLAYAEKNCWFDGVRTLTTNPDKLGVLKFPASYDLNEEFNDKGLIYLRYGKPDEIAKTPGTRLTNESWRYNAQIDRRPLIFHFVVAREAGPNNWRLTPVLTDSVMLADRQGWDPDIDRLLASRSRLDFNSLVLEQEQRNRKLFFKALSRDIERVERGFKPLKMSVFVANFRGKQGKTQLELYLGIPKKELKIKRSSKNGEVAALLEEGAGVYDSLATEKVKYSHQWKLAELPEARVFDGNLIQRYVFDVEPERYRLSFYARLSQPRKLGGGNFQIQVPAFDSDSLDLSELELAYKVGPVNFNSIYNRGEYSIIPNPSARFSRADPVYLYFEIYNLQKNTEGHTSYDVEYEIKQEKAKKGGLFSFLGGKKKKSLAIANHTEGTDETAIEYASFDVSKLGAGDYTLTVKVKDLVANTEKKRSVKLKLEKRKSSRK